MTSWTCVLTVRDLATLAGAPQSLMLLVKFGIIWQPFAPVRLLQPSEAMGRVWTFMVFGNSQHDQHCKHHHRQTHDVHGDACVRHECLSNQFTEARKFQANSLLLPLDRRRSFKKWQIIKIKSKFSKATTCKHGRTSHQPFMLLLLRSAKYINPRSLG